MKLRVNASMTWTCIALAVFGVMIFGVITSQRAGQMTIQLNSDYVCDVKNPTGSLVFNVYMPVTMDTARFNQFLCDTLLVNSQYSQVRTSHTPRSNLHANHLSTQPFHLMFSRDYFLQSLLPGYESFYHELIEWPRYQVSWMSKEPLSLPLLTSSTIGLLGDEKSQSGYMEPLKYLTHLGLNQSELDIVYYNNRESMLDAFRDDAIDIVPFPSPQQAKTLDSRYHVTIINDQLDLGSWYLHRSVAHQSAYRIKGFLSGYLASLEGGKNDR
ncbi:hypothetical protein RCJ22_25295 [Vibrio sp. FNV 38]|nr:hypothetical protein [Vibrio sp. FNV 38]